MQDGSAPPLATAQANPVIGQMITAFITNAAMIGQTVTPQTAYDQLKRCCLNTGNVGDINCKYVTSHGICQTYMGHINNGDNQSAMQAISTFANQEGISSPDALALVQRCCNMNTGDIPCEDFWPSVQQQQGWCQKWQQAQGNQAAIQAEINNLATVFGITNAQAQSVFTRCCPGTGDRPCPPADPNSPFYTTDRFCETDWCVDGQGNPLPNAHPDCVCCDDDTSIDVSPWCPQYVVAVDNADLSAMQSIITAVSTQFNLSWAQASQLLYDECICPDNTNTAGCPPANPNSPFYTNPGEFCPQCQPGGYYHGLNHPDCRCCDDNSSAGPCDGFVDNGCCGKCDTWNGDPTTNNMGGLPLMGPNHQCSQFCAQYGANCCPNLGAGTGGGTRMPSDRPQARLSAPAGSIDNPLGMGSLSDQKLSFTGQTGSEAEILSWDDFVNDVP